MNITVVSVDAFPRVGGISAMGHHLANALVAHGHDVVFVGPEGSCVPREHCRDYRLLEDVDSRPRDRSGPEGLIEDTRIRGLVERVIDRYAPDRLLLLHPFYYAVGALDACRDRGVPCSVYFHGFELRSQLGGRYPRNQSALVRERRIGTMRERLFYTIGASDEILVNSRYTGRLIEPFQVHPPVRVTGCGIPVAELERELELTPGYDHALKRERRARLGLGSAACLGFVGRLIPTKGVERILRLCRATSELSAIIVGAGPEETALREKTRRWGLEARVRFLGGATDREKWNALRAADFLCLLSQPDDTSGHVEGFGIALLEGAAAGAVPVSSGTGGMTDVVAHRRTGLVLSGDDWRDASLLVETAANEIEMGRLLAEARRQLQTKYTWAAVAERICAGWAA